jgi:hypothetical protein
VFRTLDTREIRLHLFVLYFSSYCTVTSSEEEQPPAWVAFRACSGTSSHTQFFFFTRFCNMS